MANDYSIEIQGLKELQRDFKKAPAKTTAEVNKALFKSALYLQGRVREYAPVKTGTLRRSISYDLNTSALTAKVGTNLIYAPMLEFGTKGHGPVRAKFLAFKIGGKWIRTKYVRGIKPRYFFKRAKEASVKMINDYFDQAAENIVKFLANK